MPLRGKVQKRDFPTPLGNPAKSGGISTFPTAPATMVTFLIICITVCITVVGVFVWYKSSRKRKRLEDLSEKFEDEPTAQSISQH
jgi:hypothetical protein